MWIWGLIEPHRLAPDARAALESTSNEKWLSPISVWETLVLAQRGRLRLEPTPFQWVRRQLSCAPILQAPFDYEIALLSRETNLPYEDPVDRFIVATARACDLMLVTADARLLAAAQSYNVLPA